MAKKRKLNSQKHGQEEETSFMEEINDNKVQAHDLKQEQKTEKSLNHDNNDHQLASSSENLGSFLRSHREKRNLTLENISHVTKISIRNLGHLENNDLSSLPDKIYVFGYVKNYAKVLTIDNKEPLALLEKEYHKIFPPEYSAPEPKAPIKKEGPSQISVFINSLDKQSMIIIGLIIGLLFIISLSFMFSSDSSDQAEKKAQESLVTSGTSLQEQGSDSTPVTPISLNSETPLQKEIEEDAEDSETDLKVDKAPDKTSENVAEKKEEEIEVKKDKKKGKKSKDMLAKRTFYTMNLPLYENYSPLDGEAYSDLVPSDIDQKYDENLQNIFVYAKEGSCWVTYQTSESKINQRYVKSGKYTFVQGKEIRMAIGNTGSARVFLNKTPIKLITNTGVKNLVIPQENSTRYKMPLFVYNKEKNSFLTSADYMKKLEEQEEGEKQESP